jgi:hypothetical protein
VSDLASEILLRLARAAIVVVAGTVLYLVLVGPIGEPPSLLLALVSFLVAAAVLQILTSSPI